MTRWNITYHARLRYIERFSEESRNFAHLSKCKLGCPECHDLTHRLKEMAEWQKYHFEKVISEKLQEAEDVRCYLNDTNFMMRMHDKYGYDRFRFLVNGDILFVVTDNDDNVVLTCMDVNNPVNGSRRIANFVKRPKFRKKIAQ